MEKLQIYQEKVMTISRKRRGHDYINKKKSQ
jgi:hypothetical protein